MKHYSRDRQYTYKELAKAGDVYIKKIDDFIGKAVLLAEKYGGINPLVPIAEEGSLKNESEFSRYQNEETVIQKNWNYDREHQLDTVIINNFNSNNETNIESVKIVYGPAANEYTRSRHALALAVAEKIYFRNGAFKPETEEGQKLLAHELTHVAQYKENRITKNTTKEELEDEAVLHEAQAEYDDDPVITILRGGKLLSIRKSHMTTMADTIAEEVLEKLEVQKELLSEEEYLSLLVSFRETVERGEGRWLR